MRHILKVTLHFIENGISGKVSKTIGKVLLTVILLDASSSGFLHKVHVDMLLSSKNGSLKSIFDVRNALWCCDVIEKVHTKEFLWVLRSFDEFK